MESYWSALTMRRLTRRRALGAAAGAGVAAAAISLIGCGSGDGGGSSSNTKDSSGLLGEKVDTTKQAVAGGTWPSYRDEDVISLNPLVNTQGAAQSELIWGYSMLVKHSFAVGHGVGAEAITGDAAESWEISPDAMQITLKLRPNLKLDPRAPTNGRNVTVQDVKYSWDTAEKTSPYRPSLFNSASPAGPIKAVETPDSSTIVMKMAFPYAPVLEIIGHQQHPLIVPVEADGRFNPNADMRGSGPYILSSYQQSSRFEYERNPNWYVKGRPLFDKVVKPIISDYAAGLAQFESKAIWDYEVRPADVLRVKRDHPELVMLTEPRPSGYITQKIYNASKQPGSPLADVRVRRAFSMTVDRDLYIDAMFDAERFRKEGLPVETGWNSHLAAYFPSWIDPRNEKELGEGARYFRHDPAEAKKLMQAAGVSSKARFPWGYYTDRGTEHTKINEIVVAMAADSGLFDVKLEPLPYASTWRDVCQLSNGDGFSGFCYNSADGFNEDAYLVNVYTPEGKFATSSKPTPILTDMVLKSRTEPDAKKRSEQIKEIQRLAAKEMHYLPIPGRALGFTLRWPWLKNHGIFETGGATARPFTEAWYDAKLKT
jgi:ABC-type transport system substrate-binding protein